jgi:serine acetyltransferase
VAMLGAYLRCKGHQGAGAILTMTILFHKGVKALACARVAGHYWRRRGGGGKLIARLLQSEGSDMFGVDIHPGA